MCHRLRCSFARLSQHIDLRGSGRSTRARQLIYCRSICHDAPLVRLATFHISLCLPENLEWVTCKTRQISRPWPPFGDRQSQVFLAIPGWTCPSPGANVFSSKSHITQVILYHIHAALSAAKSYNPCFHQLNKNLQFNLSLNLWTFEVIDRSSCLATSNSWRDPFTPINAWQASRGMYQDLSIEVENPLVSFMVVLHAETCVVPQKSPYR